MAHGACLPRTVDHVVADGAENQRELSRQVVQRQRADAGQVGPQVPVDPGALDADQSAQVQAGPRRILGEDDTTS